MKRLLSILTLLLFAVISYGQTIDNITNHKADVDVVLDVKGNLLATPVTYWHKYFTSADTLSSVADSTFAYTFAIDNLYDKIAVYTRFKVDTVSGEAAFSAILQGKTFWDASWTPIDTVSLTSITGADTSLYVNSTTVQPYRFYRFYVEAETDSTQNSLLQELEIKLVK
jgi:hypothetical protein